MPKGKKRKKVNISEDALRSAVSHPAFLIVLLALVAGVAVTSHIFYRKTKGELLRLKEDPSVVVREETVELVEKVGKLMTLPVGESPTVATISDKSLLDDQDFFRSAENGDRVLIYQQARKAILYRPSINKIIEVAPVNIGDVAGVSDTSGMDGSEGNTDEAKSEPEKQKTLIKVAIYNGTGDSGAISKVEAKLEGEREDMVFEVTLREGATEKYSETLIVDVFGNKGAAVEVVKGLVGGKIEELPTGEKKPDGDVLIIIGSDFSTE